VLARLERCTDHAIVVGGRRGDGDAVEVVPREEGVEVARGLDLPALAGRGQALAIVIPDRDQLGARMLAGPARVVVGMHVPEPDGGNAEWTIDHAGTPCGLE
jgi:hypothetical protein